MRPFSQTALLDERVLRCGTHAWTVKVTRVTTLPPDDPVFDSLEDVQSYFGQMQSTYHVVDENTTSDKSFASYDKAWEEFCKVIVAYAKYFPMIEKGNDGIWHLRRDVPDPKRPEI